MATAPYFFKQLFVRRIYAKAVADSKALSAVLDDLVAARFEENETGKVLVGSAGNKHSGQFQIPDNFSPMDAACLVAEMYQRYDEAKQELKDNGTANPTDLQIKNEMLDKLDGPANQSEGDYWNLRMERDVET